MTTFHLIRHAAHTLGNGVLVGRQSGIALSAAGREQATALAAEIAAMPADVLQSSPRRRARETAAAIAARREMPVEIVSAVDEVEVGSWTGRRFNELDSDPRWNLWNTQRSAARPPGGESMQEVSERVLGHLSAMRQLHPRAVLLIVSHAEIIRTAVLHCLRRSFDEFATVTIALASITTIVWDHGTPQISRMNEVVGG